MRLWHKDLIPVLPRMQLIAQWRECCLIARQIAINGTPNHILVNKVTNYPMEHFMTYCYIVNWWLKKRGYSPSPYAEKELEYHTRMKMDSYVPEDILFDGWHNERYLYQCAGNLEEKFDCGGIPDEEWEPIEDYISDFL